jgi:hypothetical protein
MMQLPKQWSKEKYLSIGLINRPLSVKGFFFQRSTEFGPENRIEGGVNSIGRVNPRMPT